MKALRFAAFGEIEKVLHVETVERPVPRAGEVLIEVHAASINPFDVKNVQGSFPLTTLPRIPGALTLFGVNTTLLDTIGAGEILDGLRPAFEDGQLSSPDIARTFPVEQAIEAYKQIAGGTAKGKMVMVFKE